MSITKNSIFRKLVIISLAVLLYASTLLGSYNRSAYAVAPAVPLFAAASGAGYAATGAYVLGGLLVAGGAAAIGLENADEIKTSAMNTWDKFDSANKALWTSAIQSSIEAGQTTLSLTDDLIASLQSNLGIISEATRDLLNKYEVEQSGTDVATTFINHGSGLKHLNSDVLLYTIAGVTATGLQIRLSYNYFGTNDRTMVIEYSVGATTGLKTIDLSNNIPAYTDLYNANTYADFLKALNLAGISLSVGLANTVVPTEDYFNDSVDTAINDLSGIKEVNLPLDNFLATNASGEPLSYSETSGAVLNPDGTTYTGDITWDFPIPFPTTIPDITAPAVPISTVSTGTGVPFMPSTPTGGGGTGGTTPWLPIGLLLGLFDLLRAILMYLARMFTFILTIPLIPSEPIDNQAFEWFRNAEIIGIEIYNVVSALATVGLAFAVYKAVRRLLP